MPSHHLHWCLNGSTVSRTENCFLMLMTFQRVTIPGEISSSLHILTEQPLDINFTYRFTWKAVIYCSAFSPQQGIMMLYEITRGIIVYALCLFRKHFNEASCFCCEWRRSICFGWTISTSQSAYICYGESGGQWMCLRLFYSLKLKWNNSID